MSSKISLSRKKNANKLLSYLLDYKKNFLLETSNYTTTIITEDKVKKFVVKKQSARTFAAYSKIQMDVKDKEPPKIKASELIYFQHDFSKDAFIPDVMNIDLKSAYSTILYRDGYISEETFLYLGKCNKYERLASVGMLASNKKTFRFEKGIVKDMPTETRNEKAGIFFYCVRKTFEIMSNLKMICGQKYLFTWVDGIYFIPDEKIYWECIEVLENAAFDFSIERLANFKVQILQGTCKVTFQKENSKGEIKNKLFHFSHNPNEYQKSVLATFNTHKNTNNETTKSKVTNQQS